MVDPAPVTPPPPAPGSSPVPPPTASPQPSSGGFSGILSSAGDFIGNMFKDPQTGQTSTSKILITLGLGALGAYMGSGSGIMGMLGFGAAGALGGSLLAPVIMPLIDSVLGMLGLKSPGQQMPGLVPPTQPDRDITVRRNITVAQPGQEKPIETFIDTPNMDRFKKVSDETHGLVSELVTQRRDIEGMADGVQRSGAIRILLEREGKASKLLANTQEWDKMAADWSKPGGESERLKAAYKRAKEALGESFNDNMVPQPPKIDPKLPDLPPDLKSYAINSFAGSGGGTEAEFNARYPRTQDKITFAWNAADQEMKDNTPNFTATRGRLFGLGPRTKAWGPEFLENQQRLDSWYAEKAFNERNWDEVINRARSGINASKGTFSDDNEAIAEFQKAERYAIAAKKRDALDGVRTETYREIQRIETETSTKFPQFINDVTKMEAEIKTMNLEMQRGIKVTARAEVPGKADQRYVTFLDKATNTEMTIVARKVGEQWQMVSSFKDKFDPAKAEDAANMAPTPIPVADIFTDRGIVNNTDFAKAVNDTLVPVRSRLGIAPAAPAVTTLTTGAPTVTTTVSAPLATPTVTTGAPAIPGVGS
jgi:hypothetical protein